MCQRSHVFWEVGNTASAIPRRQVLKTSLSVEIDIKAEFLDPQTKLSLSYSAAPIASASSNPPDYLKDRAPDREIAAWNMLNYAFSGRAKPRCGVAVQGMDLSGAELFL